MRRAIQAASVILALVLGASAARAFQSAALTPEEEDKVRDAQDPSERIKVYIEFEQTRLDRLAEAHGGYEGADTDHGAYLARLLGQYTSLIDEMKDWIDDQYDRGGDMRAGLKTLLDAGPKQLDELRGIQQSPGPYAPAFQTPLNNAIADMSDALDGAAKGLSEQEKKFGELKREEKVDAREAKQRRKEEEKRNREEKKLLKKMEKKQKKDEGPDLN
jgi:hypothetical protein